MSNDAHEADGGPLASSTWAGDRPPQSPPNASNDVGPDPVIGAGIALLGIFLMGVGGAQNAHYLFNFGVLIAVLGAILFVLFVAVTALKQRRALGTLGSSAPDGRVERTEPPS